MPWGAVIGAVGSIAGGLLGSSGQSGSAKPWKAVRPYLKQNYKAAQNLDPQQFYPGQTWVNPLQSELAAYGNLGGYNNFMYGAPTNYLASQFNYPGGAQTATGSGMMYAGGSPPGPGNVEAPVPGGTIPASAAAPNPTSPSSAFPNWNPAAHMPAQMAAAYNRARGITNASAAGTTTDPLAGYPAVPGQQTAQATPYNPYGTPFGSAIGAMQQGLGGGGTLGNMASNLAPYATNMIGDAFAAGPGQVGGINPYQYTPTFGRAGGLDARGALNQMLSGQPDYSGLQSSIDAANAPILRQFNQEIIPGLNQRATFLNNGTGGIKTLNSVMPDIAQRMSENAATLTEAERNRALAAQAGAAGLVSQGGLSAYGLGLQGSGLGLQSQTTNANLLGQYRGDTLGLGNLAGSLAGNTATNQAQWASLFPSLANAGAQPYQDQLAYGAYQRGLSSDVLSDYVNRWNFAQQAPYNQIQFQSGIYSNVPGMSQQQPYNSALGALGGALTGAQLGTALGGAFSGGGSTLNPYQFYGSASGAVTNAIGQPTIPNLWPTGGG